MRKIMFNDRYGLTDAVLDGRKTMTRRVITIPDKWHGIEVYGFSHAKGEHTLTLTDGDDFIIEAPDTGEIGQILPTYKIGEEVAIAQSYKDISQEAGISTPSRLVAKAGWTNKMFVKAELMPHRIRITDIRVERLQDISDEDCLREGIKEESSFPHKKSCPFYFDGGKHGWDNHFSTPRKAFAALIDQVSGKGTWESNPYVWVYSFELIK